MTSSICKMQSNKPLVSFLTCVITFIIIITHA